MKSLPLRTVSHFAHVKTGLIGARVCCREIFLRGHKETAETDIPTLKQEPLDLNLTLERRTNESLEYTVLTV